MATLLLVFIYIAFISLGLPDSLLGAAWPLMRTEFGAALDAAGPITMVITGGTIISSLTSERLIRRFGTWKVTCVSVLATALALLGISFAGGYGWMLLLAVPLGLGAGAVDTALNNYVALHYKAHHMSWLHCFWGVGAFSGPLILSAFMQQGSWRGGYLAIGVIQCVVTVLLFATLPLYTKQQRLQTTAQAQAQAAPRTPGNPLAIPGVPFALATFLFYCAAEYSAGLWGSSFLVEVRGFTQAAAARGAALFYLGITVGRLLNGFLTAVLRGPQLIRLGIVLLAGGGVLLALPLPVGFTLASFLLLGLGCAPIFPTMLHETPRRFGEGNSQRIIGLQMAAAYTGSMLMPPLLGWVATRLGMGVMPLFMLVFALGMLLCTERINRMMAKRGQA